MTTRILCPQTHDKKPVSLQEMIKSISNILVFLSNIKISFIIPKTSAERNLVDRQEEIDEMIKEIKKNFIKKR